MLAAECRDAKALQQLLTNSVYSPLTDLFGVVLDTPFFPYVSPVPVVEVLLRDERFDPNTLFSFSGVCHNPLGGPNNALDYQIRPSHELRCAALTRSVALGYLDVVILLTNHSKCDVNAPVYAVVPVLNDWEDTFEGASALHFAVSQPFSRVDTQEQIYI